MSNLSAIEFQKAADEAVSVVQSGRRVAEKVLALAIQISPKAVIAREGELRGQWIVLARVATIAYVAAEDGKIRFRFNCSDALQYVQTEEQWITLAEFTRIQKRMQDIIGMFPPFVRCYLCGSTKTDEIRKSRDWFLRLFGALSKLPRQEWAASAQREEARLQEAIEREKTVLRKPQPVGITMEGWAV